jgi:hypothetical protein
VKKRPRSEDERDEVSAHSVFAQAMSHALERDVHGKVREMPFAEEPPFHSSYAVFGSLQAQDSRDATPRTGQGGAQGCSA